MSPLELDKKVRQGQHATIDITRGLTAPNTLCLSTPATANVTAQIVSSAEVGPPRCCWQVRPSGQSRPLHGYGAHHAHWLHDICVASACLTGPGTPGCRPAQLGGARADYALGCASIPPWRHACCVSLPFCHRSEQQAKGRSAALYHRVT